MTKPHIRLRAGGDDATPKIQAKTAGISFSNLGGGAHHGASYSLRDVAGWNASRGSADADLLPDLPELQYRARDIRRNNGFAHGIVQTAVDNVVGTGLRLSAQPDYLALQRIDKRFNKDWADEWGAQYESLFHEWWWSTACHAGDTLTGDMLTEQVLFSKFDNGGSLTLPLWIPNRGDGFSTKLQTVEIDRLSNPNDAPNTTNLRGGIEFDDFGVPLYYNIRRGHPGDLFFYMSVAPSMTWERIPRRTRFGRLRVIHDFDGDRADQTRGKPLLSAVLDQFKNLDRYVKAEIQAALMNAMIWGAITTPLEHEEIVELFKGDEDKYMKARSDHAVRMQAGTLATLFPGDKLESFMPQRPAAQFGVFTKNVERIISVGADMPYELAKKDFSDSNYSNTRAAMLEAWRSFSRRRDRLGAGWLDPINGLFMEEMVNAGRIEAPRYYEFRRAYQRCTYIGPGRGYVDKTKEVTGDLLSLAGNTNTLQRICAEQGLHWREVQDQRATERRYAASLGLPEVDPKSLTSGRGSAGPADESGAMPDESPSNPRNPSGQDGAQQQETA